jgi:hypothetical protein
MESSMIFLAALVVVGSIHTGDALQCYVCNSGAEYEGDKCADPLPSNADDLLFDCQEEGLKDGKNYTMCRKFLQDVEGDYRVVRTCASDGRENQCVDRTGTTRIKLRYCECTGDKCNSASTKYASVLVVVSASFLLAASHAV